MKSIKLKFGDLFLLFIFINMMSTPLLSQITISPEIGITSSPYKVVFFDNNREVNLLFGISGEVPLTGKFYLRARFSYNNMSDIKDSHSTFRGRDSYEY